MKIAIGSDRQGFAYKEKLVEYLRAKHHEVIDVGPYDKALPVDYPIYGEKVGRLVAGGECEKGIVICATGIGIMIACNKVQGVRCGMGYNDVVAQRMREHNDANVIAFGQNHMTLEEVINRTDIFLKTDFLHDYHCARIKQIADIEEGKAIQQSPYIDFKE